jgi:phosphopantothenoylcysteine synthetase/decarboxylase
MKVIVTTGPSYEPIDEVRRITNFSSGELGLLLANALAGAGCEVFCLKGAYATSPIPLAKGHLVGFTTNDDLHEKLARLASEHDIAALFHVAALCDYKVARVEDEQGARQSAAKIESRAGALTLSLEPARKVIAGLRQLFPKAALVGWKYELNGTRSEALAKVWRQISECHTNACVVNGRAWGEDFGFCAPPDSIRELADKQAVADFLVRWLRERSGKILSGA